MKFTKRLNHKVNDVWQKTHQHPFVVGIGTGNVAKKLTLAELIAAHLPCRWSYREISKMLAATYSNASDHHLYGEWVKMYASSEIGTLATWLIDFLDRLADGKPEREFAILGEHFLTTSRFEYMFWDMVYEGGEWPV